MSKAFKHLKFSIELITPQKAKNLLKKGHQNRRLKMARVKKLASIIENDELIVEGNPIKIDRNGTLADGFHRLNAIIMANKPAHFPVLRGIDPEARFVMDTGAPRTWADALNMKGEKNYTSLSSALNLLFHYTKDDPPMSKMFSPIARMTHPEMFDLLEEHPGMRDSSQFISSIPGFNRIMSVTVATFCHYIFSQLDLDEANDFFRSVATGANLQVGDPVLVLRDKIIAYSTRKRSLKGFDLAAWTIIAWNKRRQGKRVRVLRWAIDDKYQRFPIAE